MWACEQGAFVNVGLQNGEMFSSLLSFCVFDAMCIVSLSVFADRQPFVASCVCVCAFLFFRVVECIRIGLGMDFAGRQPFVARCLRFLCCQCYVHVSGSVCV